MTTAALTGRVRLSIELALTFATADPPWLQRQEETARRLGMSGAEIDAARRGRSFDARASLALALALATSGRDGGCRRQARARALKAGFSDADCDEIGRLAATFGRSGPSP